LVIPILNGGEKDIMGFLSHFINPDKEDNSFDDQVAPSPRSEPEQDAVNLSDLMTSKDTVHYSTKEQVSSLDTAGEAVDLSALQDKKAPPVPDLQDNAEAKKTDHDRPLEELERILLQALMDHLTDVVYFKDLKSRFIIVNAALANKHLSTSDPSRALGRTDFDFFAQEHARKAYEDEQKIITTGKPLIGIEEKETWPDGHETWVRTSKFPLKDAEGKIIGTWGISKDITDRKKTELELKASEEQLRQSQKMEAFGQLAGGIAHDFNNMISVILGAAQLVEMDLKETAIDTKRNIEMVIDTSKRAADLTQQLLAFARKGKYTIVPIDTHEVIHSVVGLISHTFDKKIRIVERLNALSTTIMGDFAQLQNAILNLALNARDAMPDGGTFTLETATVGPAVDIDDTQHGDIVPGSFLRLRVIDTGCGMDEKTKAHVFEPFFTTKGPGKGTGLGLASVYGTVKNIGGIIEFDSLPGKGTRFTMFIPLVLPAAGKKTSSSMESSKTKARILIVDDEQDLRLILSEILEHLGFTVFTCKDGLDAVEYYKLHHENIDAVIVDLVMPRMGGHECIKLLKQIDPSARILVSSGYNLVSDTQQIIAKGIAGFIQKPYLASEISRILFETLGGN
jgi:PAS domain S-box-containing protein